MQNVVLEDDPNRIDWFAATIKDIIITTTPEECFEYLIKGETDVLFLDHDLLGRQFVSSDDPFTGMELTRMILKCTNKPAIGQVIIHSCNHVGAINIYQSLKPFYNIKRLSFPFLKALYKGFE